MMTSESTSRWYDASFDVNIDPKDSVYTNLFQHVRAVEEDQVDIHKMNMLNARLYSNREPMFFDWNSNFGFRHKPISFNTENVIQSVVDTLRANISKNRVKATVLSTDASFSVYQKARLLDRYLYSEFQFFDVYTKAAEVFKDCLVYQIGALHLDINRSTNQIEMERVHPDEIIVDQRECTSSNTPDSLFRRKLVDRRELLEAWTKNVKDKKKKKRLEKTILEAQTRDFVWTSHRSPSSPDLLVLIEAWKVGPNGRHTIALENGVLLDEEYTRDKFPILFLRFEDAETGFYGRSLVEALLGYQIRLNELNDVIKRCQDLYSRPRVWLEQGSEIVDVELNNALGYINTVRGTKPEVDIWQAVSQELYNERDRTRANAFEFAGISQLSAQSKLPSQARLDSSEALREFSAIENQRFSLVAQRYEKFFLQLAEHLIELSTILYRNRKVNRKTMFNQNNLVQLIDWKSIDLDRDRYVLHLGASSTINMTPAGRKDIASDWAARGWINDPSQIAELLGQPDLEHLHSVKRSPRDVIYKKIDKLLQGEQVEPEQTDDLMMSQKMVTEELNIIKQYDDLPDEILDNFEIYLQKIEGLVTPEQPVQGLGGPSPAPQAVAPEPGMAEGAVPGLF